MVRSGELMSPFYGYFEGAGAAPTPPQPLISSCGALDILILEQVGCPYELTTSGLGVQRLNLGHGPCSGLAN